MTTKKYLPQIDGLRAVAVIAVIAYHFDESWLPSGYLGVDIFFVISGYVITAYLRRSKVVTLRNYLLEFYVRRFKRLMPALLFSTFVSSIAIVVLATRPSSDIFETSAIALFGLSNIFLFFRSSDYFSLDASLNAFTHTWSLGVEEQFYLLYPTLIAALGIAGTKSAESRKVGLVVIGTLSCISLIAYLILSELNPTAAFYLLPARTWELGAGALTYLFTEKTAKKPPRLLAEVAFTAIVCSLFFSASMQTGATVTAVVATSLLISSCNVGSGVYWLLASAPIVWVGLLSYSLYLWHWPILVLGKYTIGLNGWAPYLLLILIISFAVLSYYFVEKPLRHASLFRSRAKELFYLLVVITICFPVLWNMSSFSSSYNNILASSLNVPAVDNWVDDVDCHGAKDLENFENPLTSCLEAHRTSNKPSVLYLIGDSHAAQFYLMFEKAIIDTEYQLRFINYDFPYKLLSVDGRSKVLDFVVENSQENDIVAVSFHRGRLNDSLDAHLPTSELVGYDEKEIAFKNEFTRYQTLLVEKKVKVMLIRDTPLMDSITTSPSCFMQVKLFGQSMCRVSRNKDLHTRTRQDRLFDNLLGRFPSTCVWDPLDDIYMGAPNLEVVDKLGNYVMWDWNHISQRKAENLSTAFRSALSACINRI